MACQHCSEVIREDDMAAQCDRCGKANHQYCIRLSGDDTMGGPWYCANCVDMPLPSANGNDVDQCGIHVLQQEDLRRRL